MEKSRKNNNQEQEHAEAQRVKAMAARTPHRPVASGVDRAAVFVAELLLPCVVGSVASDPSEFSIHRQVKLPELDTTGAGPRAGVPRSPDPDTIDRTRLSVARPGTHLVVFEAALNAAVQGGHRHAEDVLAHRGTVVAVRVQAALRAAVPRQPVSDAVDWCEGAVRDLRSHTKRHNALQTLRGGEMRQHSTKKGACGGGERPRQRSAAMGFARGWSPGTRGRARAWFHSSRR